jgi:hypothetical protein
MTSSLPFSLPFCCSAPGGSSSSIISRACSGRRIRGASPETPRVSIWTCVFSKSKGTTFLLRCPCNHKVELEDGKTPAFWAHILLFRGRAIDHASFPIQEPRQPLHSSFPVSSRHADPLHPQGSLASPRRRLSSIVLLGRIATLCLPFPTYSIASIRPTTTPKSISAVPSESPKVTNGRRPFTQDTALTSSRSCTTG